jgi:hypothetical protein
MANLQRCALTAMGGDRDGWRERGSEARPELSRGEDDPERQLVQTPGFEGRLRACAAPLMAPSGCVGGWRWRRGASQLYNLQGATPRHAPTTQCRFELVDGGERVAVLRLLCTMAKSVRRETNGENRGEDHMRSTPVVTMRKNSLARRPHTSVTHARRDGADTGGPHSRDNNTAGVITRARNVG